MAVTKKEILEGFVSRLQQILDGGQIPPWQKPWTPQFGPEVSRPHNPVTGHAYKGFNSLDLELNAALSGYHDPRWMGFKQALEQGWHVRKGEKACHIHLPVEIIINKDGHDPVGRERSDGKQSKLLVFKRVPVFNAQQIDGIPPLALAPEKTLLSQNTKFDAIAHQMGVRITEAPCDQAFYRRGPDLITLPLRASFADQYGHDSTLAHELAHATGHVFRLNRDLGGSFGSIRYAAEEVTAEIGAYLTCKELGIAYAGGNPDMTEEQHLAYTANWANNLKTDPKGLGQAIDNGIKASQYLSQQLGLYQENALNGEQQEGITIAERPAEHEENLLAQAARKTMEPESLHETLSLNSMNGLPDFH